MVDWRGLDLNLLCLLVVLIEMCNVICVVEWLYLL